MRYNKNFNYIEFDTIKNDAGLNSYSLSTKKLINKAGIISIESKAGRYGGTYLNEMLTFHFANWLNPKFYLLFIEEFIRLKKSESKRKNVDWSMNKVINNLSESLHLLEEYHKPKK